MKRKAKKNKAKLPFDPKVFLAKVNGGRSISIIGRIKLSHAGPLRILFSFRAARSKTVVSEQGKEAVVGLFWNRRFFGEVHDRTATACLGQSAPWRKA